MIVYAASIGAETGTSCTFYLQVDATNYPVTYLLLSTSAAHHLTTVTTPELLVIAVKVSETIK